MANEKAPNKTLVFLKIRTTKLVGPIDPVTTEPFKRTNIEEACFLAVKREDIECATVTAMPDEERLSVLVIPWFHREPVLDEGVPTGEYIDTPVYQERLNEIRNFLSALQLPICFVAHNGVRLDFKILVTEFPDVLLMRENLRYVDTWHAFKRILDALPVGEPQNVAANDINEERPSLAAAMQGSSVGESTNVAANDSNEERPSLAAAMQGLSVGESTNVAANDSNEERPSLVVTMQRLSVGETRNVAANQEIPSFSFRDLYRRLLNKIPPASRTAETKCRMMLECVVERKDQFLTYADDNFKFLYGVTPMDIL